MSTEHSPEPGTPTAGSAYAAPDDPFGTDLPADGAAVDDADADGFGEEDLEVLAKPSGKRLALALLAGLLLAVAGTAAWTLLVYQTGRRFAIAAVVVGLLIGFAVRKISRRATIVLGVVAALLALASALAGNWFEVYASVAKQTNPITQTKLGWSYAWEQLTPGNVWDSFKDGINWTSYLTWTLATLAAFVYAIDSGKKKTAATAPVVGTAEDLEGDGFGSAEPTAADGVADGDPMAGSVDSGDDPVDSGDD